MNIQRLIYLSRLVLFGGNANNGTNAGFGYLNANNDWTNANTNYGSRNSSIKIFYGISTSPLGERQQLGSILLGHKSHERNIEYCKGK